MEPVPCHYGGHALDPGRMTSTAGCCSTRGEAAGRPWFALTVRRAPSESESGRFRSSPFTTRARPQPRLTSDLDATANVAILAAGYWCGMRPWRPAVGNVTVFVRIGSGVTGYWCDPGPPRTKVARGVDRRFPTAPSLRGQDPEPQFRHRAQSVSSFGATGTGARIAIATDREEGGAMSEDRQ